MNRLTLRFALMAVMLGSPSVRGQNMPHLGYVYPAGGRQGATFQIVVGGQFLSGATNLHVSGPGIQGKLVEYTRPLTQREFNMLRDQMRELQDRRIANRNAPQNPTNVWTAADDRKLAELRRKVQVSDPRKQPNPAIAETVTLQIAIAADSQPGERELRLAGPLGLSNPLVFCVGQLPEFSKRSAKSVKEAELAARGAVEGPSAGTEMTINLPGVVNGQIMPGGVDRFRFKARQGQKVVAAVSARQLIPYLPDAVPGWFQATLALYDAKGKEVAYTDDFRFHPDPILYYEIPKDGEYVAEIRDSIYRGREDFVYRMTLAEVPLVTSMFPLGGRAGVVVPVELQGWNLAASKISVDSAGKAAGVYPVSEFGDANSGSLLRFALDTLPECVEREQNNEERKAQLVKLPIIVNGRVDQPADRDVYRLVAAAGDELVAEVMARRLGSPMDSVLKLVDSAGQQIAFNDDNLDQGAGLSTHHADSWIRVKLAKAGTYYLHVADQQNQGGPEFGYRLRISRPRPDFELRVAPSSISVRSGASVPLTVYALRKDGFSNEIRVVLKDAPKGFSLSGANVPANQQHVRLTLSAPANPDSELVNVQLEGRAMIDGREVSRAAVPADDMMQAFSYRHLVPAKELKVAVLRGGPARGAPKILGEMPLKIPAGGTARIELGMPPGPWTDKVRLELSEPPDGIKIRAVSPSNERTAIVLQSDATKVQAGLKGNLIVLVFGKSQPAGRQGNSQRAAWGALPAIPFEIVAQ